MVTVSHTTVIKVKTDRITVEMGQNNQTHNRTMVTYQQYMKIALRQCGGGRENMTALGNLWSAEKETIEQMNERELKNRLNCP